MTTAPLLEVRDLGKRYGTIIALSGVSTRVQAGSVTCVLGDNGAGKSTLIKIFSGVHQHDEGELLRISEALDELARVDAALSQVVDLKFFCGFSFAEIAAMRGVSERTVQRQWEKARIYLHRNIRGDLLA